MVPPGSGQMVVLLPPRRGGRWVDDGDRVNGQVGGLCVCLGTPGAGDRAARLIQPASEQPTRRSTSRRRGHRHPCGGPDRYGGIGGNAPLYLVTRDQPRTRCSKAASCLPARATFARDDAAGDAARWVSGDGAHDHTGGGYFGTLYYHQMARYGDGTHRCQRQRGQSLRVAMRTGIFWSHRVRWSSPIRIREESWMQSQGLYYYRARYW